MTLAARNSILFSGIIIASLLSVGSGIFLYPAYFGDLSFFEFPVKYTEYWWLHYDRVQADGIAWVLPAIFGVTLFSTIAGYLLRRFFRKTVSFEMFFFTIFILSLSLDAVRSAEILLVMFDLPPYFGIFLSRIVHFGHFFGLFCIFTSSLYAMNIQYQKLGTVLGIAFLLAFTLSAALPFDSTELLLNLTYRVGYEKGMLMVFVGFELFTLLNILWAAFMKSSRDYAFILVSLLLVIAGRELLFFLGSPLTAIAGGILLISGTVMFGKKLHTLYLWV